ncbi:MAG: His/Gly/Thr/Pro-type tRNA ligase C-terminal domain-containing protein [Chloroflexota bacterium]
MEVDDSSNRMQNKIRVAQEQKVPWMLVLGDARWRPGRWRHAAGRGSSSL